MAAGGPLNFERQGVLARAVRGGLLLRRGRDALLLDAPPGIEAVADTDGGALRAVLLSGGRVQSVGGLVPLLCALEPHRPPDLPLRLGVPLGDERGALLAGAWARGWGERFPLQIETAAPGPGDAVGPFEIETFSVRRGEPRWAEGRVEAVAAVAFRVEVAGLVVAFAPGAAPTAGLQRVVRGADLVVLEVGVRPWPGAEAPWRLTPSQAVALAPDGAELWILGDDGRPAMPQGRTAH